MLQISFKIKIWTLIHDIDGISLILYVVPKKKV